VPDKLASVAEYFNISSRNFSDHATYTHTRLGGT
jgi:hypothetical protein